MLSSPQPAVVAAVVGASASTPVVSKPSLQSAPASAAGASVVKRPGSHMKRIRPMQHDGVRSFNNAAAKAGRTAAARSSSPAGAGGDVAADAKKPKLQLAPVGGAGLPSAQC